VSPDRLVGLSEEKYVIASGVSVPDRAIQEDATAASILTNHKRQWEVGPLPNAAKSVSYRKQCCGSSISGLAIEYSSTRLRMSYLTILVSSVILICPSAAAALMINVVLLKLSSELTGQLSVVMDMNSTGPSILFVLVASG
jgi:hypothetical protein